jgi:hypothetical protein
MTIKDLREFIEMLDDDDREVNVEVTNISPFGGRSASIFAVADDGIDGVTLYVSVPSGAEGS